jgi:hypothetical protein
MKIKLLSAAICSALMLTACGAKKVMLDVPSIELARADVMPTREELAGEKTKVVVFNPDDTINKLAKAAGIGNTIGVELSRHITETGSEIVDRNMAKQLEKELQLAEMHGKASYEGPKVADYAITGAISTATISSSFAEAYSWTDKNGQVYVTPASCTYTGSISGTLKIYSMIPSLRYMESVSLNDRYSTSQETRDSSCPLNATQQQGLVSEAARSAVKSARIAVQNFFAPKAYILEAKPQNGQTIFKLSAGRASGFKEGEDLSIYTRKVSRHPITGDETVEDVEIIEGEISATIGDNYAWIVVDDPDAANRVRLGDFIKVRYSIGFLEGLGGLLQ